MNKDFENIFKKEFKKEFEEQLGLTINQTELKKVIREYKKIKKFQKTPLYQVMQMDKKANK
jgi:hypothetical protein